MTTGRDVFYRAMRLLGYSGPEGQMDGLQFAELYKRSLPAVNQIYSDLFYLEHGGQEPFAELTHLDQPLKLSPRAIHDVMPYGVAMLIAQTEGDGDNQLLCANLYNQKRQAACAGQKQRVDVIPGVCI